MAFQVAWHHVTFDEWPKGGRVPQVPQKLHAEDRELEIIGIRQRVEVHTDSIVGTRAAQTDRAATARVGARACQSPAGQRQVTESGDVLRTGQRRCRLTAE